MRKTVFAGGMAALFVLVLAVPAFAGPTGPKTSGVQVNAGVCDPGNSKMVLNIVYQVTGDADSGVSGYWAMDTYTKHIQVWDMGGSIFCVLARYNGSFVTVDGKSPSGVSNVSAGVTGTMEGGYSGYITGTFSPATKRTKGNVGSKDYACTIISGVATGCSPYDWMGYFSAGSTFDFADAGLAWSWTYNAGENGTWTNAGTGNIGDITGSSL